VRLRKLCLSQVITLNSTKQKGTPLRTLRMVGFAIALILAPAHQTLNKASASQLNNKIPAQVQTAKADEPKPPAEQQATATPVEAPAPTPAPQEPVPQPVAVPSTHEGLMAAAGISPEDYGAVDYIVSHESSWNQSATEPTTGAHGLVQALPFSKTGCGWEDAVCTLAWGQQYAVARYGGWQQAMNYWVVHRNW
jgi:hypothetical protein